MLLPDNDTLVHLIQLSVAPVFLLAGVAGLLNVFTGRLTRIIDKLEKYDAYVSSQEKKDKEFKEDGHMKKRRMFLVKRMENTNLAIFLCTATGLMVAFVILTIFASTLFSFHFESLITGAYVLSMIFLISSLLLFLREIYYTTSFIRNKKDRIE